MADGVAGEAARELAGEIIELLTQTGATVATAESLTGGAIAVALTAVAGSSDYMAGGLVTYQSEQKIRQLGVMPELIECCGVVSEEVASAMVCGAAHRFGVECAVAVTGIAGPVSAQDQQPVGTVWIATSVRGDVRALCYAFEEVGRDAVRFATVKAALRQLCEQIDAEFLRTT